MSGAISSGKSEGENHNVSLLPSLQYDAVKTRSSKYKEKRKKQPITKPWSKHFDYFIILLSDSDNFGFTRTVSHERNRCSASDAVDLVFTWLYHSGYNSDYGSVASENQPSKEKKKVVHKFLSIVQITESAHSHVAVCFCFCYVRISFTTYSKVSGFVFLISTD